MADKPKRRNRSDSSGESQETPLPVVRFPRSPNPPRTSPGPPSGPPTADRPTPSMNLERSGARKNGRRETYTQPMTIIGWTGSSASGTSLRTDPTFTGGRSSSPRADEAMSEEEQDAMSIEASWDGESIGRPEVKETAQEAGPSSVASEADVTPSSSSVWVLME
ncbi:hypothetical protein EOD39_17681 [Acipenser ruthenus]|uniref:Uncharacterized protein n=1 Tax=Acipenser ruthenus TaxID=7906 RepID=A0A444U6F8_ACIRT|nr:hypothetical protein EOD39_17681 [Acipenser ruthenus]